MAIGQNIEWKQAGGEKERARQRVRGRAREAERKYSLTEVGISCTCSVSMVYLHHESVEYVYLSCVCRHSIDLISPGIRSMVIASFICSCQPT